MDVGAGDPGTDVKKIAVQKDANGSYVQCHVMPNAGPRGSPGRVDCAGWLARVAYLRPSSRLARTGIASGVASVTGRCLRRGIVGVVPFLAGLPSGLRQRDPGRLGREALKLEDRASVPSAPWKSFRSQGP